MAKKIGVDLLAGERKPRETPKAIRGCNDYMRLEAGRSLSILHTKYTDGSLGKHQEPPTKSLDTLKGWSLKFGWVERANLYDLAMEARRKEIIDEKMYEGLGHDAVRVEELKQLFEMLKAQMLDEDEDGNQHNLWLPDVKGVGSGFNFEKIDVVRYNSAIIKDMLAVLDDSAKETGGRVRKSEHTGKDGGPIETKVTNEGRNRAISTLSDALGEILSSKS